MNHCLLYLRVAAAEFLKGVLVTQYYRLNIFVRIFSKFVFFFGVNLLLAKGRLLPETLAMTLIGYTFGTYTFGLLSEMAWVLNSEIQSGTLEQMHMSVVPMPVLLAARLFANMMITTFQMILFFIVVMSFFSLGLQPSWAALYFFLATLSSIAGFSLVLGGLTLIYKHTESLVGLFYNIFIFLSGALLPLSNYPVFVERLAYLLPGTWGIIGTRGALLPGAMENYEAVALKAGLSALIYLGLGSWFFSRCERSVRQQASLNQY